MSTANGQLAAIANLLFGKIDTGTVAPTNYYVGLCTGGVTIDGVITGEVVGGDYSRVEVANNKTTFSTAGVNGVVSNLVDISFPESSTAWGTITTVFISSSMAGGTAMYYYNLPIARAVQQFTTVTFRGDATGANGDLRFEVVG